MVIICHFINKFLSCRVIGYSPFPILGDGHVACCTQHCMGATACSKLGTSSLFSADPGNLAHMTIPMTVPVSVFFLMVAHALDDGDTPLPYLMDVISLILDG